MAVFNVVEKFVSINGEGQHAGRIDHAENRHIDRGIRLSVTNQQVIEKQHGHSLEDIRRAHTEAVGGKGTQLPQLRQRYVQHPDCSREVPDWFR